MTRSHDLAADDWDRLALVTDEGMPEVIATFEDGSTKTLFWFYPDEVWGRASEFVGLTEEEAHSLFQQKDTAYLPTKRAGMRPQGISGKVAGLTASPTSK